MPRDAITLADVRLPTIVIVCEPRGGHNVKRLIAKHGTPGWLPDLLTIIADCPKTRSFNIYDRGVVCALLEP